MHHTDEAHRERVKLLIQGHTGSLKWRDQILAWLWLFCTKRPSSARRGGRRRVTDIQTYMDSGSAY